MDYNNLCVHCMQELSPGTKFCENCGESIGGYVPSSHHLPPNTILNGRYLLGKVLGEGGFGITYIAVDLQKDQRVAVKELFVANLVVRENSRTVLLTEDPRKQEFYNNCKSKFRAEADILRHLEDKRGVVNFLDYFEENSTAYIVMEYLDGDDLSLYLKKRGGRISCEEAFVLLRPVMKSLMLMHKAGVYHRDISPDNIRYLKNSEMKIMDLGGAKFSSAESEGKSLIVMLKKGYAPPEQYTISYKIGPWMDVYAMGATIYRCITGIVPQESPARVQKDLLQRPGELGADVPPEVEAVIMKALALRIENRYIDMYEFYNALKAAMADSGNTDVTNQVTSGVQNGLQQLLEEIRENDKKDKQQIKLVIAAWAAVLAAAAVIILLL